MDEARRKAEAAAARTGQGLRHARKATVAARATAALLAAGRALTAQAAAVQLQLCTDELHESRRLLALAQVQPAERGDAMRPLWVQREHELLVAASAVLRGKRGVGGASCSCSRTVAHVAPVERSAAVAA